MGSTIVCACWQSDPHAATVIAGATDFEVTVSEKCAPTALGLEGGKGDARASSPAQDVAASESPLVIASHWSPPVDHAESQSPLPKLHDIHDSANPFRSFPEVVYALLGCSHLTGLFRGFGVSLLGVFSIRKLLAPAVEHFLFESAEQTWLHAEHFADANTPYATVESGVISPDLAKTPRERFSESGRTIALPGELFCAAVFSEVNPSTTGVDVFGVAPSAPELVGKIVAVALSTNRLLSNVDFLASHGLPPTFGNLTQKHFPHFFNGFLDKVFMMEEARMTAQPAERDCAVARVLFSAPLNMRRLEKEYARVAEIIYRFGHLKFLFLDPSETNCAAEVYLSPSEGMVVRMSMIGEKYVWTQGSAHGNIVRDASGQICEIPFDPGDALQLTIQVDSSLRLWMLGCTKLQLPQIFLCYTYRGRLVSDPGEAPWRTIDDLGSKAYSAACSWRILKVGKLPGFTLLARPVLNVDLLLDLLTKSLDVRVDTSPVAATETNVGEQRSLWRFVFSARFSLPRKSAAARSCTICLRRFVRKQVEAADGLKFWGDAFVNFAKDLAQFGRDSTCS